MSELKCKLCKIRPAEVRCSGCYYLVCMGCVGAIGVEIKCWCGDVTKPWVDA